MCFAAINCILNQFQMSETPNNPIQLTADKEFWMKVVELLSELPINKALHISSSLHQAIISAEKPIEENTNPE
jgi:hypothetical protein